MIIHIKVTGTVDGKVYMSFKPSQTNVNGEIVDGWGVPFRITYISDTDVRIVSAGPDNVFGTGDDITGQ